MGIFSDECMALIDKNTGAALTGEALEQAQFVDDFLDIYENSFEPHGG